MFQRQWGPLGSDRWSKRCAAFSRDSWFVKEQRSGESIRSFRGKQAANRREPVWLLSGNPFPSFHKRSRDFVFVCHPARNNHGLEHVLSHQIWLHVLLFNNRCNGGQHCEPLIQLRARQTKYRCTTGYHGRRVLSAYVRVLAVYTLCVVYCMHVRCPG